MNIEVCTDNLETAIKAGDKGCKRVELCSALSVGGLTPSIGLIEACVSQSVAEIHVMIRHQPGSFIINDADLTIMKSDIRMAQKAGAKGVVFGCLTPENEIDLNRTASLVSFAKTLHLEVTFHRAFDFVLDPKVALEQLIALKIDRVLTSGQADLAIDGLSLISELVKISQSRIQVMAGSGVNAENALALINAGVDALHFTANLPQKEPEQLGMGQRNMPDEQKIMKISNLLQ